MKEPGFYIIAVVIMSALQGCTRRFLITRRYS